MKAIRCAQCIRTRVIWKLVVTDTNGAAAVVDVGEDVTEVVDVGAGGTTHVTIMTTTGTHVTQILVIVITLNQHVPLHTRGLGLVQDHVTDPGVTEGIHARLASRHLVTISLSR